jgi:hypothetical protein
MNTQSTPLVQKMILLMLVLIFGCLVLMLVNGRKQIENLRASDTARSASTNDMASIHDAFPRMRSSRPRPIVVSEQQQPTATPPTGEQTTNLETSTARAESPAPVVVPVGVPVLTPDADGEQPSVVGRVLLIGTPPAEIPIRFDQTCGAFHPTQATTRHYVVSRDQGLANVFVYISKGLEGKKFAAPSEPVLLDQKDCMYQPYIIGAMVNQPIRFKNSDPVLHNIHSLPRATGNVEFNIAQPVQDQTDERTFSAPEVLVKVKCEVHDWMFAYVGVVNNPFFAVTDTNGVFELPEGLPSGNYEVTAMHLKAGTSTQRIKVRQHQPVGLTFKLPVAGNRTLAAGH